MVFPAQGGKLMNVGGMNRTIPISIRSFGKKGKTKRRSSKINKKIKCDKCKHIFNMTYDCKYCKIKNNFVKKGDKYICTHCYYDYCNICERIKQK
jgi:hypothetical protein